MSGLTDGFFEKLKADTKLKNFNIKMQREGQKLNYPIQKPLVVIGSEHSQNVTFLLGNDDFEVIGEVMTVIVAVDEQQGGTYCEECAKLVCTQLLRADEDRRITSVSADKCAYDKNSFAYRLVMHFALREYAESGGE